jgi:hypothetical protein
MNCQVFSVGYRCSSAGILKYLNVKQESYPFDWLISRLEIIKDCIDTNFTHFLNIENYEKIMTKTIHYGNNGKNLFICDENIIYNKYYQEKFENSELIIPWELQVPYDTYSYNLAMNHKNIFQEEDLNYYKRCIDRFNKVINNKDPKMYLYIHPTIEIQQYNWSKDELINKFLSFQTYMSSLNVESFIKGLFILVVRTNFDHPVTNHIPNIIENINKNGYCSIYILYTHKNFVDGGEIFMQQNTELETSSLINLVSEELKTYSELMNI